MEEHLVGVAEDLVVLDPFNAARTFFSSSFFDAPQLISELRERTEPQRRRQQAVVWSVHFIQLVERQLDRRQDPRHSMKAFVEI